MYINVMQPVRALKNPKSERFIKIAPRTFGAFA